MSICPQPKTDVEQILYRDIQRYFNNHSLTYSLYQFYTSTLGLNPYKTVLEIPSWLIWGNIYFSYNGNYIIKNNRAILSLGDKIFRKDKIDLDYYKYFSDFYCDLVVRLNELYDFSATHIEKHEQLIEELLSELDKLEETLNDSSISSTRRQAYSEKYQRLSKGFYELLNNTYSEPLLENAKNICNMVQCRRYNDCENYDKEKLEYFTMEAKDYISDHVYKVPKINFKIDINDCQSNIIGELYTDIIAKLREGKMNPKEILQNFSYFQSYDLYRHNVFEGKVIVAFEKVMKIPIEFGAWFNPEVYQITINNEVNLEGLDYSIYTKYCRIPKKVIIGITPIMIVPDHNAIPKVFAQKVVSILGYEVDSSLCDSPLIGSFEKYNNPLIGVLQDFSVKDEL